MAPIPHRSLEGTRVLVTGGLGFLGSSLAHRLVRLGADVLMIDVLLEGCGGNPFNIEGLDDRARLDITDVRDAHAMKQLVRDRDLVFHMAGQVSHVLGLEDPFPDLDINIRGTAVLLDALRRYNPKAKLVFASTRGVYDKDVELPVREDATARPTGVYELSKLASEDLVRLYNDVHGLGSIVLRLSNIFGPRGQMRRPGAGIANWFCRLALDGDELTVFGDGSLARDFLFIDDAVEAMLRLSTCDEAFGQTVNVGHDEATTLANLAQRIVDIAGTGSVVLKPFPWEWKAQHPRDYRPDLTRLRDLTGWSPQTSLVDGLERTLEYYREYRAAYWSPESS